jgi:hypothetical protein
MIVRPASCLQFLYEWGERVLRTEIPVVFPYVFNGWRAQVQFPKYVLFGLVDNELISETRVYFNDELFKKSVPFIDITENVKVEADCDHRIKTY